MVHREFKTLHTLDNFKTIQIIIRCALHPKFVFKNNILLQTIINPKFNDGLKASQEIAERGWRIIIELRRGLRNIYLYLPSDNIRYESL